MRWMEGREASCACGQLTVRVVGDPVRTSVCHCLACQRRSGSVFSVQARFPTEGVQTSGRAHEYVRVSDAGVERVFSFCPDCGGTVFFTSPDSPNVVAVPVGAFADPTFPTPSVSVHDARMHTWFTLSDDIERDLWAPLQVLYEKGRYGEASDRGADVLTAHPGTPSSCTTSPAARASPGGPTTRSPTCARPSPWKGTSRPSPPTTPTSTRSAIAPTSRPHGCINGARHH